MAKPRPVIQPWRNLYAGNMLTTLTLNIQSYLLQFGGPGWYGFLGSGHTEPQCGLDVWGQGRCEVLIKLRPSWEDSSYTKGKVNNSGEVLVFN